MKKLLIFSALLLTSQAFGMQPYTAPDMNKDEWLFKMDHYIGMPCPNCHEYRLFPSEEFVVERLADLTQSEILSLTQAVTDYTGDYVPGRFCAFCGLNIFKHVVSREVSEDKE
jgi:hypothetical protein